MSSQTPHHAAIQNDPGSKETVMTKPDDNPQSMSQLLQLLERKLDNHIENSRYAESITTKRDGQKKN